MARRSAAMQVDMFSESFALVLEPVEAARLRQAITAGNWGGNQILADVFQRRERHGHLTVTDGELEDAYRKAWMYGDGGWQRFFREAIMPAAQRAGWQPSAELEAEVWHHREQIKERTRKGLF